MDSLELILQLTGAVVILYLFIYILCNCVEVFKSYLNRLYPPDLVKKYGKWAVVTGSSDGIGLQYARELARRGMNVVLMSFVRDQLLDAAKQIEADFKVETKAIVTDFSHGCSIFEKLREDFKEIDIGILVNNVGVAIPNPMMVEEMTEKQIWDHVSVNILAGTMMTKIILPDMKNRGRGAIVNVASHSAAGVSPYFNIYASSKVYVDYMSRALEYETRGSGIFVQTLLPGFTNTRIVSFSDTLSKQAIMPSTLVKYAISSLGVSKYTSGYIVHGIQLWFFNLLPAWIYTYFSGQMYLSLLKEYKMKLNENKKL